MSRPVHRIEFADSARMFAWIRVHDLLRRLPLDSMALVESGKGRRGRARELLLPELGSSLAGILGDLERFDATKVEGEASAPKSIPFGELWRRVSPARTQLGTEALDTVYVLFRRDGNLSGDEVLGKLAESSVVELALQVFRAPDGGLLDAFRVRSPGGREAAGLAALGRSRIRYWAPDADRPTFLVPLGFDLPLLRAHPELYEPAVDEEVASVVFWAAEAQTKKGWAAARLQPLLEDWVPISGHLDLGSFLVDHAGATPADLEDELVTPRFPLRFWPTRGREQTAARVMLRFQGHGGDVGERMLDWLDHVDAGLDAAAWFVHHPVAEDAGPFGQVDHYLLVDGYSGNPRPMGPGTTLFLEHPWLSQYGLPVFVESRYGLRPDPGPALFGPDGDPQGFVAELRKALLADAAGDPDSVQAIVLAADTSGDPDHPVSVVLRGARSLSASGQDLLREFHPIVQEEAARAAATRLVPHADHAHEGLKRLAVRQSDHVQRRVSEILDAVRAQLEDMDAEWSGLDATVRSADGFHRSVQKHLQGIGESWTEFVQSVISLHKGASEQHRAWHEGFDSVAAQLLSLVEETKGLEQKAAARVAVVASSASERLKDIQHELQRVEELAQEAEKRAGQVDTVDRAVAVALQAGRDAIEREEKRLQGLRAQAESQMAVQEGRRRELDQERSAVEALEAELQRRTKDNDDLEARLVARRRAAEEGLQRQLNRRRHLESLEGTVIPGVEKQLAAEQSSVAKLEAKGLEARHAKLSAALAAARDNLARLRAEEESLKVVHTELEEAKQAASRTLDEIDRLKILRDGPLRNETNKLERLRAQLAKLEEQASDERLRQVGADLVRTKDLITKLEAEIRDLRAEHDALEVETQSLRKAREENERLEKRIRQLRATADPDARSEVLRQAEANLRSARRAEPRLGLGARILRLVRRRS